MPLADPFFRRLRLIRSEAGFSLIEALFATVLFAVVSAALMGVLTSATAADRLARQKTLAEQAAQAQVEWIRSLTYDRVGLSPVGNPTGVVPATKSISVTGLKGTLTTDIHYVNHDGTPTSYATGAFYKKVTVTVARASDGKQLASEMTFVAPPNRAPLGGIDQAVINLTVYDYFLNKVVPSAVVDLYHVSTTVPIAEAVTDAAGTSSFSALDASSTSAPYDLKVTVPGYQTLADDASPKTPSHVTLAPSQTYNTAIHIYKPATLYLQLNDAATGTAYAGSANVTLSSSRKTATFAFKNGDPPVTTLGGEPLVPNSYTVTAVSPTNPCVQSDALPAPVTIPADYAHNVLTSTIPLTLNTLVPQNVSVHVQKSTGTAVSNATVQVSDNPDPGCGITTATTNATGDATLKLPPDDGWSISVTSGTLKGRWPGATGTATLPAATSPITITVS
jgi:type II secretory pathway pseudopilin PulG